MLGDCSSTLFIHHWNKTEVQLHPVNSKRVSIYTHTDELLSMLNFQNFFTHFKTFKAYYISNFVGISNEFL